MQSTSPPGSDGDPRVHDRKETLRRTLELRPWREGQGTLMRVRLRLAAPEGRGPAGLGDVLRPALAFQIRQDLRRFKSRMEAGEIDPGRLITHRLTPDEAPAAYRTFRDKEDECIEVVLRPDGSHGGNGHSRSGGDGDLGRPS